jgi:hypothetical protein
LPVGIIQTAMNPFPFIWHKARPQLHSRCPLRTGMLGFSTPSAEERLTPNSARTANYATAHSVFLPKCTIGSQNPIQIGDLQRYV